MLLLFLGVLYHIPRRLGYYLGLLKNKFVYLVFISIYVLIILVIAFSNDSGSGHLRALYFVSNPLIGVVVYCTLFVSIAYLISLLHPLPIKITGYIITALTLVICSFGLYNATQVSLYSQNIQLEDLDKNIRIVHISDAHLSHYHRGANYFDNIIEITNEQNLDYVFITGDFFEGQSAANEKTYSQFKKFNAPVYYTEGKYDMRPQSSGVFQKLRENGVTILENKVVDLGSFYLIGLNYMKADKEAFDCNVFRDETIDEIEIPQDKPAILMQHSPQGLEYANEKGIDLLVCGHLQGVQLYPFTILEDFIYPSEKGLNTYSNMQVSVSQGTGASGPNIRVGTKNEIRLLNLRGD